MIKETVRHVLERFGIQMTLKKNLWYLDPYEIQRRIITKTDPVIFDVGASEGSVVQKYKGLYPGARIHAFEPQPDAFAILRQKTDGEKDVICTETALSDSTGKAMFHKARSGPASSLLPAVHSASFVDDHTRPAEQFEVTLETLDHYCEVRKIDRIDILKMDVQGNELNILKGGRQMLSADRISLIYSEVWFIAAYDRQPFYEDIALFLREFGYLPFGLYNMHWDLNQKGKNLWADAIFVQKNDLQ